MVRDIIGFAAVFFFTFILTSCGQDNLKPTNKSNTQSVSSKDTGSPGLGSASNSSDPNAPGSLGNLRDLMDNAFGDDTAFQRLLDLINGDGDPQNAIRDLDLLLAALEASQRNEDSQYIQALLQHLKQIQANLKANASKLKPSQMKGILGMIVKLISTVCSMAKK